MKPALLFAIPILAALCSAFPASSFDLSDNAPHPHRPFDTHQLASYIANHYHESLETILTKTTNRIGTHFRNAIQIAYSPSSFGSNDVGGSGDSSSMDFERGSDVDLEVFSKQLAGAVDTYVKDEIPLVLANSPLYTTPLAQSIENLLLAHCPPTQSPTSTPQDCLRRNADFLTQKLDDALSEHVVEVTASVRKSVPVIWINVKNNIEQVVRQLREDGAEWEQLQASFVELKEGDEADMVPEAEILREIRHGNGHMLRNMITITENQL
ncbi:uncharacterized protein VTP21DRAFT_10671 [Calcarisporiella thermophila]|uniref:uncharacterized protein n=1 Tax=Calcarisporiella thermophila TaxID=911321 RepID=UPI0037448DF3